MHAFSDCNRFNEELLRIAKGVLVPILGDDALKQIANTCKLSLSLFFDDK